MSIGAMLREQREAKGWQLPDIAADLRIRLPYLEAIEADDYAVLPGSTFTIGFIRTYSEFLGFDSEKVLRQFRKDNAEAAERPALIMRVPIHTARAPTGTIVAAALLLIALIWGGWTIFAKHDRTVAETVPAVPDRLKPAPAVADNAQAVPAKTAPASAVAGNAPEGEPDADEAMNDTPEQAAGPFVVNNVRAPAGPGVNYGTPGAAAGHVEIRAVDDSWVQVIDDSGASVFTGILHPGDTFPVPAGKNYTLTTGNAGGIELALDGVAGQPLGETGRIIRGIALDPERVALSQAKP